MYRDEKKHGKYTRFLRAKKGGAEYSSMKTLSRNGSDQQAVLKELYDRFPEGTDIMS